MSIVSQILGTFLGIYLQGNTLFFCTTPLQNQTCQTQQVFDAGISRDWRDQQILAYGKEPAGPHIWVITGRFQFSLISVQGNNIHIDYKAEFFLYVKRTMEITEWLSVSPQKMVPEWSLIQADQSRPQRFLYSLPPVQGTLAIDRSLFSSEPFFTPFFKNGKNHPSILPFSAKDVSLEFQNYIIGHIRTSLQNRTQSFWNSTGLLLVLPEFPTNRQSIYIFLGDYTFRRLSGETLAVAGGPCQRIAKKTCHSPLYLLRLKNDRIQLSSLGTKSDNSAPLDLPFSPRVRIENGAKIHLSVEGDFTDPHLYLRIGEKSWLCNHRGEVLWQSGLENTISPDETSTVLSFSSEDYYSLTPSSERLVFFKIFLNKQEVGRTEPTIGSRKKEFKMKIQPGRHLVQVERWELIEKTYHKSKNLLQPLPIFISVEKGHQIRIELPFRDGEKPQLRPIQP